jgi:hypothetical protein
LNDSSKSGWIVEALDLHEARLLRYATCTSPDFRGIQDEPILKIRVRSVPGNTV